MPRGLSRYVKKVVKGLQEKKVLDHTYITQADNDGEVFDIGHLRFIRPGNTMIERIGDQIDVYKLIVRGQIYYPEEGENPAPPNATVRLIIFQWDQDEFLDFPTPGDIISFYTQADPNGVFDVFSPYSKDNSGKFQILYDKMFTLSIFGETVRSFKITLSNFKQKTIPYYLDDTGTPDIHVRSGGIYALLVSDIEGAEFTAPEIWYTARTIFTDS